uniref:Uncharacterized protein n=1 Tax=Physcomitrium patens TaxID=3218 RepID=A0A2K1IJQ0_PHYPA|nr:hypothetical protein PHYPA_028195 [Physcomitrium patens]
MSTSASPSPPHHRIFPFLNRGWRVKHRFKSEVSQFMRTCIADSHCLSSSESLRVGRISIASPTSDRASSLQCLRYVKGFGSTDGWVLPICCFIVSYIDAFWAIWLASSMACLRGDLEIRCYRKVMRRGFGDRSRGVSSPQ